MLWESVQGVQSSDTPYFAIHHRNSWSPLQQCKQCHATLQWRVSAQWSAFWASCWNYSPFWGLFAPQKKRIGGLTCKILKLAYYQNYCTDSNQILHIDKDHQITTKFRGWSKQAYKKSKIAVGRHLLNLEKWPNLQNSLNDWRKIWRNDAHWMTAILKNKKQPYLDNGMTDWHEIWLTDAYWPSEPTQQVKFRI